MSFRSIFFKSPVYNVSDIRNIESPLFDGQNLKNILIVCKNYESQKEFLSKIMKAVNIDLSEDVALFDCEKQGTPHWAELSKSGVFKKVILFGLQPSETGLHILIPHYKNTIWTGIEFLLADGLSAISEDKNKKQQLWTALKEMFV